MSSLLKHSIQDIINNYKTFFFFKKNVVGISLGNKSIKNINTNEPVLRILVSAKLPLNELYKEDIIPKNFLGIKTDVFKVGNLNINREKQVINKEIKDINFLNSKHRPLQGGISISPINVKSGGTLGGIVFDNENNKPYILSNCHLLADEGRLSNGNSIVQPATIDYRWSSISNKIGRLERSIFLRYKFSEFQTFHNYADAAIASINSNVKFTKEIYKIGAIKGVSTTSLDKIVQKTGKKTGHTFGGVTDVNACVEVNMKDGLTSVFSNQILTSNMSEEGDSGSLVLDAFNNVVGLLFAASEEVSVISPIDYILKSLNIHF